MSEPPCQCSLCRVRAGLQQPSPPVEYETPRIRQPGEPCTCGHCEALREEMLDMADHSTLRKLATAATPGPWEAELDCFSEADKIEAVVSTEGTRMLFSSGTDVPLHRQAGARWTEDDELKRDAQWAKARETQELRDAQYIAAANPSAVLALLDELDEARAEVAELRSRLAGAEAANAADTERLTEHSELSGHIDTVEQCRDWIEHEHIMEGGDTSGRLRDFVESLRIVVDQLDKQRRSRNWYKSAYSAGKQKLIEHALSKVCCSGEPHTCDQEAIAAAESKTDRLILELTRLRPVYEAAVEWHQNATTHLACCRADNNLHAAVTDAIDAAKER